MQKGLDSKLFFRTGQNAGTTATSQSLACHMPSFNLRPQWENTENTKSHEIQEIRASEITFDSWKALDVFFGSV